MTIKLNVKIASDLVGREYRTPKPKKDELECWLIKHKINFSFHSSTISVPDGHVCYWDKFIFKFPDEQTMLMFILKWIDDDIQIEKEAETLVLDVIDKVYNKNV